MKKNDSGGADKQRKTGKTVRTLEKFGAQQLFAPAAVGTELLLVCAGNRRKVMARKEVISGRQLT